MKEIWKDIKNYEEYYQISNLGRVKNKITNKILSGDRNSMGYHRVILYNPIKKRFFVHRLVAFHFCNGYKEDLVVNHKDGNKRNNIFTNLEWVTRSENDKHAFRNNLRKAYPCQFRYKIVKYDLKTNKKIKTYENAKICAEDLNVNVNTVYATCRGKNKSCKGFGLKYELKLKS